MAKFKQEVLEKMKSDPDLFTKITKELGLKPTSTPGTIDRNGHVLNQYSIVALTAEHLACNPEDLLEEETEPITKDTAA